MAVIMACDLLLSQRCWLDATLIAWHLNLTCTVLQGCTIRVKGNFRNVRNAFGTHNTIRLVGYAVWVRQLCHGVIFKPFTASKQYKG
jgi:hypothetical protein